MEELNLAFKDYIEEYKKLSVNEKRTEIIESIKETNAMIAFVAENENINLNFLKSKEVTELNSGLESEDDFLEALIVYVENNKNLLGQYLSNKI